MIGLKEIAKRIPDNVREQMLLTDNDPINKAKAVSGDKNMQQLFKIWYKYIEPHGKGDMNCSYCLENIRTNFKAMLPSFQELQMEGNLLKSLTVKR